MKPTLYLIDAFALIYRSYFVFMRNPRINSKGRNVSALYGFTSTLLDIIKNRKPDYIATAFEHPEGNFRTALYPEYKAQREAMPEDIASALTDIKKLLEVMQIPAISIKGYEADDIIGSLATQADKEGFSVYMVTPDKDFGQLVSPNITMLKPSTNGFQELGEEEIRTLYNIQTPKQLIDLLGIWGDTSDNVPGCKGIGKVGAAELLNQFKSIEDIYENIDQVKPSHRKKLLADRENTLLSKKLVTIVTDIKGYEFPIKDYKLSLQNEEEIIAQLQEFEFRSLVDRHFSKKEKVVKPSLFDLPTSADQDDDTPLRTTLFQQTATEGTPHPTEEKTDASLENTTTELSTLAQSLSFQNVPMRHQIVDSREKLLSMWQKLAEAEKIAFDTETTSTDALQCSLVAVSLAIAPGEVYYIPIPENKEEAKSILAPLDAIMQNERILKVAQNAKFDTQVLARYGISFPKPLFDTLLAHYLASAHLQHSLDAMALELLDHRMIPYSALSEKKNFSLRHDVDPTLLALYASEDADVTWRLEPLLRTRLTKENQLQLFEEVEIPLVEVLTQMEQVGVRFDPDALRSVEKQIDAAIDQLTHSIYFLAGEEFNISSPKQVGEILFDKLQIAKKPKKTKSGAYVTREETLLTYAHDHQIVRDILDYRGLVKLLNTYVKSLPDFVHNDGRIHCNFNQAVTTTGRLSSSNPNLQNIPIRTAMGQEIRAAFVASDEMHTFLSADYSQIELRLAAHMSEDKALIAAINAGADIHRETAAKLYHISPEEVSPIQRSFAKTANFGILYGITPFGLSQRLQVSFSEANTLIKNYFNAFPGIKNYMEQSVAKARERGYAETMLGRRRYLPDINSKNGAVRSNAERNAINMPIQGTAADLIKMAMVNIHRRLQKEGLKSKLILQIHDELNFDALKSEVDILTSLVREEMMQAIGSLSVPLEVNIATGENWLQAH